MQAAVKHTVRRNREFFVTAVASTSATLADRQLAQIAKIHNCSLATVQPQLACRTLPGRSSAWFRLGAVKAT
jgi:hypothetical protein